MVGLRGIVWVSSALAGGTGDVPSIEVLNGGLSLSHAQLRKLRDKDSVRPSFKDFP